jgi:hypothetical protein
MTIMPFAQRTLTYRDIGYQVLSENAELFHWGAELSDLRAHRVNDSLDAYSVRFFQEFKGVLVGASEVVVNIRKDGRVYSIYNNYHYIIPQELDPNEIKVDANQTRTIVERLLRVYENSEVRDPALIIYRYQRVDNHPPKPPGRPTGHRENFLGAVATQLTEDWPANNHPQEGQYFLAWDVTATTVGPRHAWRILLDAMTGHLIQVIDLLQYATGVGRVYDPNPIVTSGNTGLSSTTPIATLNGHTIAVVMDHLNPPDAAGNLRLDGSLVQMSDIELPTFAEPVGALGNFISPVNDRNFLAGMCYYHIDRFQNYIQTDLGLTNVANFSIQTDPQGLNGIDNPHYDPTSKHLAFGEGGVPDAADAYVILHEYGHAIQDNVNPEFGGGSYEGGTSEGFGDFLAAVYYDDKHAKPATTRGATFPWDANTNDDFWDGRRYDVAWLFDGPEFAGASGHGRARLWSATMFELY